MSAFKIFRIKNATDDPQSDLILSFLSWRSGIIGISVIEPAIPSNYTPVANDHYLSFSGHEISSGDEIFVRVCYLKGDVPSLKKLTWGPEAFPIFSLAAHLDQQLSSTRSIAEKNILESYRKRVSCIANEQCKTSQKFQAYFCELDYATNPSLQSNSLTFLSESKREKLGEAISKASDALNFRTDLRVRSHPYLPCKKGLKSIAKQLRLKKDEISLLSDVQIKLIRKHFGRQPKSADLFPEFRDAFEQFSAGHFARPNAESNAQPDSAALFFFAEFALLAIEENFHSKEWISLLPIFARSQKIYMEAYWPFDATGRKPKPEFRDWVNRAPSEVVNFETLTNELRQDYQDLSVDEIARKIGENAYTAIGQNSRPIDNDYLSTLPIHS